MGKTPSPGPSGAPRSQRHFSGGGDVWSVPLEVQESFFEGVLNGGRLERLGPERLGPEGRHRSIFGVELCFKLDLKVLKGFLSKFLKVRPPRHEPRGSTSPGLEKLVPPADFVKAEPATEK